MAGRRNGFFVWFHAMMRLRSLLDTLRNDQRLVKLVKQLWLASLPPQGAVRSEIPRLLAFVSQSRRLLYTDMVPTISIGSHISQPSFLYHCSGSWISPMAMQQQQLMIVVI